MFLSETCIHKLVFLYLFCLNNNYKNDVNKKSMEWQQYVKGKKIAFSVTGELKDQSIINLN